MPKLVHLLFSFKGRINRTAFWSFEGTWIVIWVLICVLTGHPTSDDGTATPNTTLSIVATIFLLLTIWPLLAVQAKRWHDRNKSAWWCFIGLVPCIGSFWVLIECGFLPSVEEGNRFNN